MAKLEVKEVTKTFKKKTALEHLSVTFKTGKIYGLLGRNSAGKTTLLKTLMTQYLPDTGSITYEGKDIYENEDALAKMCLFLDDMPAFSTLKVKKILTLGEAFYKNWSKEKAKELLNVFELKPEERYSTLSKGKKTAVAIVVGMASGCKITMFDEIYSGLDAVMRKRFYELLIEEYAESGRTFILSTHLIYEMSSLFTDVVIMHEGKVILNEETETLEKSICSVRGTKEQLALVKNVQIVRETEFAGSITWIVRGEFKDEEVARLRKNGVDIKGLSLQEIFIAVTEYEKGEEKWIS